MSEMKLFPDFHKELGPESGRPEPDQAELEKTTNQFNADFDSWFSSHHQEIEHAPMSRGRIASCLKKRIVSKNRTYLLTFTEITDHPEGSQTDIIPDSLNAKRSIDLQLLVGDKLADNAAYALGIDDIVRRYDTDAEAEFLKDLMAGRDLEQATGPQDRLRRLAAGSRNDIDNEAFEEQMGVNNQPISLKEAEEMHQFLEHFRGLPQDPSQNQNEQIAG